MPRKITAALVLILMACSASGCSSLPSMQYCDHVEYQRTGNMMTISAQCRAPVGSSIPTL